MIDYWELVKDFAPGDTVQKYMPPGALSPFVGRVTAVLKGLGLLDVQWPFGVERVYPDEVVLVNPELQRYLPPTLDQSYNTIDQVRGKQAQQVRAATSPLWQHPVLLPPGFHVHLARQWASGASDLQAYDRLWRQFAQAGVDDDRMRQEITRFYVAATSLATMRVAAHAQGCMQKNAAYWVAQNRQYRVTQSELDTKKPFCPKCGTKMRKTTFRMQKGAKHRLWGCPKDMFLITMEDMLGPDGQPVNW